MATLAMLRCGGESAASALMETLLVTRNTSAKECFTHWPEISHWEREFPLPRGRADYVVFHVDGSITVIEVKDGERPVLEILSGIGQATMYSVQLGYSRTATKIRRVLAATCRGRQVPDLLREALIEDCCRAAGVEYFTLGPLDEHIRVTEGPNVS